MEELVVILIIVIIIGALLGGKSFGGTVRKGCGFIIFVVIIVALISALLYRSSETNPNNKEAASANSTPAYYIVKHDCQTYAKPDINSDTLGYIIEGEKLLVENANKFNYFYEISYQNGVIFYIKKESLKRAGPKNQ